MADNRNALVTQERFAHAVAKLAPPAEPVPVASPSFAQRAAEILEQGRPRPPAPEAEPSDAGMAAEIDDRVETIMQLAHSRDRADGELYEELQPELRALFVARAGLAKRA